MLTFVFFLGLNHKTEGKIEFRKEWIQSLCCISTKGVRPVQWGLPKVTGNQGQVAPTDQAEGNQWQVPAQQDSKTAATKWQVAGQTEEQIRWEISSGEESVSLARKDVVNMSLLNCYVKSNLPKWELG